ncbi:MAG: relaxase/mobilization nuclease domain-containing protein [Flavobacteriales bacterium]|jgi:hypothetical protein
MVIKILSSSKTFNGIDYNEKKVEMGVAERLAIDNFNIESVRSKVDLKDELLLHSSTFKGRRDFENKQFHVALSVKGDTYSKEELLSVGRDYLKKMGYGDNPSAIYFHKDTDNNHIHIVTSRVDIKGKRINDSFERKRTLDFIKNDLGIDYSLNLNNKIEALKAYSYSNLDQVLSLMKSNDIDCNYKPSPEENNVIDIFFNMEEMGKIPIEDFNIDLNNKKNRKKEINRMKAILYKYKDLISYDYLNTFLKNKFGYEMLMNETRNFQILYKDGFIHFNSDKVTNSPWQVPEGFKKELEKINLSNIYSLRDNSSPELENELKKVIARLNPIELGYTMVDHSNKLVLKGSDVMKLGKIKESKITNSFNSTVLSFMASMGLNNYKEYVISNGGELNERLDVVLGDDIIRLEDIDKSKMVQKEIDSLASKYGTPNDTDYDNILNTVLDAGMDFNEFLKGNNLSVYKDGNGNTSIIDESSKTIHSVKGDYLKDSGNLIGEGLGQLSDMLKLFGGFEEEGLKPDIKKKRKKKNRL